MNRELTADSCNERSRLHRAAGGLRSYHSRNLLLPPDAPSLLQLFIWQEYDLAPDFSVLFDFLDHWRCEIEAARHSVRIAHGRLIGPAGWRAVDGIIPLP